MGGNFSMTLQAYRLWVVTQYMYMVSDSTIKSSGSNVLLRMRALNRYETRDRVLVSNILQHTTTYFQHTTTCFQHTLTASLD